MFIRKQLFEASVSNPLVKIPELNHIFHTFFS